MAKNDQQEAYDKLLTASLGRIVDFNKFAEAKNAAILTFMSVWLLAAYSYVVREPPVADLTKGFLTCSMFFFLLSTLTAIYSFIPKLFIHSVTRTAQANSNLLYFGDISDIRSQDFNGYVASRYMPANDSSTTDEYLHDLTEQILAVSIIARRKFNLFNISVLFTGTGIALFVVPVFVLLTQSILGNVNVSK